MHTRLTARVTIGQWDWGSYIACRSTNGFAIMLYKRNKHDKTTCRLEIDTVLQDSIGLVGFVKCARQYIILKKTLLLLFAVDRVKCNKMSRRLMLQYMFSLHYCCSMSISMHGVRQIG